MERAILEPSEEWLVSSLRLKVGQEVLVSTGIGDVWIDAVIEDAKHVYGEPRFLVRPLSGIGNAWVTTSRLSRRVCPR